MTVELSPPGPVKSLIYICDSTFFLDPLDELIADANTEEQFGVLVVDGNGAVFGVLASFSFSDAIGCQLQSPKVRHLWSRVFPYDVAFSLAQSFSFHSHLISLARTPT